MTDSGNHQQNRHDDGTMATLLEEITKIREDTKAIHEIRNELKIASEERNSMKKELHNFLNVVTELKSELKTVKKRHVGIQRTTGSVKDCQ